MVRDAADERVICPHQRRPDEGSVWVEAVVFTDVIRFRLGSCCWNVSGGGTVAFDGH